MPLLLSTSKPKMHKTQGLVLEVTRESDVLKMCILEHGEPSGALKHYSGHRVNFSETNSLCDEITNLLNRVNPKDISLLKSLEKAGRALWDNLLTHPVKEKLKQQTNASLLLDIDEELIFIPWELLYNGNNFLSLDFNIGRLVKTKSQPLSSNYRSSGHFLKMLILADPTQDLKSAYTEGLNIRNMFDRRRSDIRIDFKSSSIDKLYINKNICEYDIVHFAGHCEYDPKNVNKSGWVLKDSNFTVQDVLRLSGSLLPQLIFSNACNSVFPSGEGSVDKDYQKKNYSLASAFLFSGVRHYIGSIRKIEDNASLKFAKEFYHSLILGNSIGLSLRNARLKLVTEFGIASMHWANYILYGDPNFSFFKPKTSKERKKRILPVKSLRNILFLSVALALLSFLYYALPTINPNSYTLYIKARSFFERGDNQRAINTGKLLVEKDKCFLSVYPLIGDSFRKLGDRKSALKYYYDYMLMSQKKKDLKNLVSAYTSIGWLYQLEGDRQKSKDFYTKALDLSREIKDKLNEAIALRRMAVWHIDNREYDLALELLIKSSEINRQRQYLSSHRYNLACDYFDIGLIFSNRNDFAAAGEFYRKSIKLFEKSKLKSELSDYYFNMGEIYLFEKQYQKALDYYSLGLKADFDQGNKMNLSSDYNMIGELYLEMDSFVEAEAYLKKALDCAREVESRPDIAAAAYNLGILYKKTGKKNKSKEFLRIAQEIYGVIDPLAYKEAKEEILSLD